MLWRCGIFFFEDTWLFAFFTDSECIIYICDAKKNTFLHRSHVCTDFEDCIIVLFSLPTIQNNPKSIETMTTELYKLLLLVDNIVPIPLLGTDYAKIQDTLANFTLINGLLYRVMNEDFFDVGDVRAIHEFFETSTTFSRHIYLFLQATRRRAPNEDNKMRMYKISRLLFAQSNMAQALMSGIDVSGFAHEFKLWMSAATCIFSPDEESTLRNLVANMTDKILATTSKKRRRSDTNEPYAREYKKQNIQSKRFDDCASAIVRNYDPQMVCEALCYALTL